MTDTTQLDRIEALLAMLIDKVVHEPERRQMAAIARHEAEMAMGKKLDQLISGLEPDLRAAVISTRALDFNFVSALLDQPDPASVLRYIYLGPGKTRWAHPISEDEMRREMEVVSRRIATVKALVKTAADNAQMFGAKTAQKRAQSQDPESK